MKYKSILFSTEMVKALLDGRKTQTRRLNGLENQNENPSMWKLAGDVYDPAWDEGDWKSCCDFQSLDTSIMSLAQCPYGKPGDILWVREKLYQEGELGLKYFADNEYIDEAIIPEVPFKNGSYRNYAFCQVPNIHMPAWAARIFLQVKDVRVQRLQDISPSDACDEGIEYWNIDAEAMEGGELQADFNNYTWTEKKEQDPNYEDRYFPTFGNPVDSFRTLWQSINGHDSWSVNPWVWVISFDRIDKPKNWPLQNTSNN